MAPSLPTFSPGALTRASLAVSLLACGDDGPSEPTPDQLSQGQQIFRFDTFGDETFWTDTLRIHEVITAGVSPATALAVGLKVDADARSLSAISSRIPAESFRKPPE